MRKRVAESRYVRATWTEAQINTLVELRDKGMGFPQIGRLIGKSASTCQDKYYAVNGSIERDKNWPPRSDPWAVKVDFGEHNLRLKTSPVVRTVRPSTEVRSNYGCAARMCVE